MERREPTLLGGNDNEREEPSNRRPSQSYDEPRSSRSSYASMPPSNSPLPVIALIVALMGVGGAGYFGWQLTQTHAALLGATARIAQLENQLNVSSTESTASLGSLQVNLRGVDSEVKKLWDLSRKTASEHTDKFASISKSIDAGKREVVEVKGEANSLKQDVLSHKAELEAVGTLLGTQEKAIAEQRKRVQDVATSVSAMLSQVKSAEGLASRLNTAEEAIDAIDDNRRIINRDLLQIKQQLGIKN